MFARGKRFTLVVAFTVACGASGVAGAIGLSVGSTATVLGQALDFPVQVRLDPGETLTAECVGAEVHVSEQRLPPGTVRTVIDQQGNGSARVRVQTQQVIDEPVISISLRVGCAAPITRRFVVFADPPAALAAAALPQSVAPAMAPTLSAAPLAPVEGVAPEAGRTTAAPGTRDDRPGVAPAGANRVRARAANATGGRPAAAARGVRQNNAALPSSPPQRLRALAAPMAAAPRLTLEPALPPPAATAAVARAEADAVDAALAAVAQAANAAQVAASAAAATQERMAALERTVTQLRSEALANQALLSQMRDLRDQAPGSSPWLWPLLMLALLPAALAAWLAWRLGRLQAVRQVAWAQQSTAASVGADAIRRPETAADRQARAPTGPSPFLSTDLPTFPPRSSLGSVQTVPGSSVLMPGFATQSAPSLRNGAVAAWPGTSSSRGGLALPDITPLDTPFDTPMARTEPMPAPLRGGDAGVRDVSIEELIDLEQQAEFFVVLGQDEAAVDLLVDHLRSTGGGSPLPYLKLLEIYSRTDDRAAYERNRARFNHRFNAYAPEWGSDLAQGRSLEDYPGILPRLEQVWLRPLDAMAELEALLFRKSRGELFELPAYREVLFLYALARDLLDRESATTGSVDLLLPLADGSAFGSTAPIPFLYEDASAGDSTFDMDDRPTRPVDFDLTIPAQQTSMFDPMEATPRPKRR